LASNPKCKNKPRIYINALIYSEVYNACIRSSCDAYNVASNLDLNPKQYRATQDFLSSLKSIRGDFRAYTKFLLIETDLIHSPDDVLDTMPLFSDFNDHYYFKIAQSKGLSIVTNDRDFKYENIEIITKNGKLLALAKPN
jgi:predicted nucleic acid-binding protein